MATIRNFALSCAGALIITGSAASAASPGNGEPTCSDTLGIDVHGQHVVGDYVLGIDHEDMEWPPNDVSVGETVSSNGGAAIPGGPGPGFHFEFGFAPGASFCNDSRSPGTHL